MDLVAVAEHLDGGQGLRLGQHQLPGESVDDHRYRVGQAGWIRIDRSRFEVDVLDPSRHLQHPVRRRDGHVDRAVGAVDAFEQAEAEREAALVQVALEPVQRAYGPEGRGILEHLHESRRFGRERLSLRCARQLVQDAALQLLVPLREFLALGGT